MGDVLYGLFFSITYTLLCTFFVNCFAERRNKNLSRILVSYIIWTVLMMFISIVGIEHLLIRIFLVPVISAFFVYYLQKISVMQSILLNMIYFGLGCAVEYFVYLFYHLRVDEYNVYVEKNSMISMLLGIISQIIIFVVVSMISTFKGNYFFELLARRDWLQFSIFPLFSIIVTFSLVVNFGNSSNNSQSFTLLLISIGLLALNFMVLIIMREILTREAQIRDTELMYERASNTAQKYMDAVETYGEQKKREHEFKNHITVIHKLICNSEYERARSYTEELSDLNDNVIDIVDMNHPIINSVINLKYKEALRKGIFMSFEVCDIADISITDKDITVIISNLLNNAIEACDKDGKDSAFIKFKVCRDDKHLYISVINSCFDKPLLKNGIYVTTKDNKEIHGIGIRNIIDTVSKNNGDYAIDSQNGRFAFIICLPL